MAFWRSQFAAEGNDFENEYYRTVMLAMAQEPDDRFLSGKIVADFGCGPRGSLAWARSAFVRIGIDVLADRYLEAFGSCLLGHGMIYLRCTERLIPLPSEMVDVLFTVNALDHVDSLEPVCDELLRILKPGGEVISSFNLGEPRTTTEPQTLTEESIQRSLLDRLHVTSYRLAPQGPPGRDYAHFFTEDRPYQPGDRGYLWVRASKP